MEMQQLGLTTWHEEKARSMGLETNGIARVSAVDRGLYRVWDRAGETAAVLAGRLAHEAGCDEDLPCVGDFVAVRGEDGLRVIEAVLPRRTVLRRKAAGPGTDSQLIAAGVDLAFVVQASRYDYNPRRLERYLAMAAAGGVAATVLLTKADLASPGELAVQMARLEETARTPVLAVSAASGEGLDALAGLLAPGLTCCLLGSSGVGKTTLVNRLLGREAFAVRATSGTGEGVHTTTRRQMVRLDGGALLIDTPGMRELGLLGDDEGRLGGYGDIEALARDCRFADCRHEGEPGCAVRAAVKAGRLEASRLESWNRLGREAAFNAMTLGQRRQKDRAFGRMVKSVKKGLRK